MKLLANDRLTPTRRAAVVKVLIEKCGILAKGASRRGRASPRRIYMKIDRDRLVSIGGDRTLSKLISTAASNDAAGRSRTTPTARGSHERHPAASDSLMMRDETTAAAIRACAAKPPSFRGANRKVARDADAIADGTARRRRAPQSAHRPTRRRDRSPYRNRNPRGRLARRNSFARRMFSARAKSTAPVRGAPPLSSRRCGRYVFHA